jgi:tetratricopeptide (TPR) repeat protein
VKHIIYTVFDWMEGEFSVLPDEKSGQTEGVARFEVASLIVEGVRFRFTQEKLSRHFHPFDRSVSLAVPLQEIAREARLGKDEADFLALLATKRPIEELLRLQSFSPADSLKLLYAFQTLGWICLEKGSIPPPEMDRPEKGRSQAVAELFRSHLSSSQPPTPPSEGERGEEGGKRNWRVHSLLGAAAISLFFWIITFVDPRALRVGTSDEISRPEVPPPSPTAVPSPQATEGGASVPSPSPPIKRRVWDEATGWMARAELLRKEGNLGEALAAARKAARLRPADLTIRLRIGDILFESGRNREARDLYEGVIRSDPTLADPYLSLATAWLIERENEKAEQALRKYLALVKRTPETQGRVMEAQKVLQSLKVRR